MEGVLPDITSKEIIENEIVPNFRQNNYYRGFDLATDAIFQASRGEYKAPAGYNQRKQRGNGGGNIIGVIIFFVIIFFLISSRRRKRRWWRNVQPHRCSALYHRKYDREVLAGVVVGQGAEVVDGPAEVVAASAVSVAVAEEVVALEEVGDLKLKSKN